MTNDYYIYIYIYILLKFIYLCVHKNRERAKKKCDQKLIHPFEIFFFIFLLLKKSAMLM
jgi:hypothetical protein